MGLLTGSELLTIAVFGVAFCGLAVGVMLGPLPTQPASLADLPPPPIDWTAWAREAAAAGRLEEAMTFAGLALRAKPDDRDALRVYAGAADKLDADYFSDIAAAAYVRLAAGSEGIEIRLAIRNYQRLERWRAVIAAIDTVAAPSPALVAAREKALAKIAAPPRRVR